MFGSYDLASRSELIGSSNARTQYRTSQGQTYILL